MTWLAFTVFVLRNFTGCMSGPSPTWPPALSMESRVEIGQTKYSFSLDAGFNHPAQVCAESRDGRRCVTVWVHNLSLSCIADGFDTDADDDVDLRDWATLSVDVGWCGKATCMRQARWVSPE